MKSIRAGKRFTLFISNEYMNDIIKIVKSLKNSGVFINVEFETVKHKIKKQGERFVGDIKAAMAASFVALMAFSLIQPVVSSLINDIGGK